MPSRAKHFERWRTSSWHGVPTPQRRLFPRGAASAASSRAMRRDARRPVVHELGVRPVLRAAVGPGDGRARHHVARSGADASHPDPRASAGRRAHAASGPRRPRSRLRWTTSLRWWSRRLTRSAGGRVHRRGGQDRRTTRAFGNLRATQNRARRESDAPSLTAKRRMTGIFYRTPRRGFASGSGERLETFSPTEAATLGRQFAPWASRASDPRARLRRIRRKRLDIRARGDAASRAKLGRTKYPYETRRRPEWNASFATGSKDEARLSRVARTRASRRAPRRNGGASGTPLRRGDATTQASLRPAARLRRSALRTTRLFLTASTAFDRVGRRVASLHDAMGTRRTESDVAAGRGGSRAERALGRPSRATIDLEKSVRNAGAWRRASLDRAAASRRRRPNRRSRPLRGGLSGGLRVWRVWRVSSSPALRFDSMQALPSRTIRRRRRSPRRRGDAPYEYVLAARCAGTATSPAA